jgi:ATP-dependent RNA helicase DeaD
VRELLESDAGEGGPVELAASLMRLAAADKPLVFDQPEWEGMGDAGDRDRNMVRLYISAGRRSGLRPGQLVAAVANAANIPGKAIGAIDIRENASFFDLDGAYVAALMDNVKRVLIQGNRVKISPARPHQGPGGRDGGRGEGAYEDRRSGGFRPRTPKPHRSHAGPRGPRRKPSDSRFRGKR